MQENKSKPSLFAALFVGWLLSITFTVVGWAIVEAFKMLFDWLLGQPAILNGLLLSSALGLTVGLAAYIFAQE